MAGISKKISCISAMLFVIFSFGILKVNAQDDPFSRLNRMAAAEDTAKKILPAQSIGTSSPLWSAKSKSPVPFRPITARDYNVNDIPPNQIISLSNGNKMTASVYFAKLNKIEKEANKHGYSLRDKEVFRSKTVTPASFLEVKSAQTPNPSARLKTQAEQEAFLNPILKSGTRVIKPLGDYTPAEKRKVLSEELKNYESSDLTVRGIAAAPSIFSNTGVLKTINETSTKDYSFGDARVFQAGAHVSLKRLAKIYGQGSKKTEFTITGTGKIYGSVLGNSFTVVNSSAVAYVPVDSSKKMTLKLLVNITGIDVLNTTYEHAVRKTVADNKTKPFEYGKSISFPLIWGISITGRVGVKGSVGYSYSVELDRAFLKAQFKPIADIKGFLEIGLSAPLDIASIGVRTDLIFLKGFADLSAWFGIYNSNQRHILLGYGYDVSFYLEFLKGELKLSWRVGCVDLPFVGERCLLRGEHTFLSFIGRKITGTYTDGRFVYDIYSGPIRDISDAVIR